jgi:phage shock protein E
VFWLIVLGLSVGAPVMAQLADETAVPRVSVADLKKAADAGQVLIVDVRDARSFADGHIPGAVNVPFETLEQKVASLKAAKKGIVTYCS